MAAPSILKTAAAAGLSVKLDEGRLILSAARPPDAGLLEDIHREKAEIVEYLLGLRAVPSDHGAKPDEPAGTGAGERDRARSPREPVSPVATIATVATEAASSGRSVATVASVAADRHDAEFEERAAIVEHDGGIPRKWAEGFARLDLSKPPAGFGRDRWRQLIDDGGRFIDRWAVTAAAMGWSAIDVFGLHPDAPAARYDGMGLVPLIGGGEVIAVEAGHATIRTPGGSCLTYYLRRRPSTGVPVWQLAGRARP